MKTEVEFIHLKASYSLRFLRCTGSSGEAVKFLKTSARQPSNDPVDMSDLQNFKSDRNFIKFGCQEFRESLLLLTAVSLLKMSKIDSASSETTQTKLAEILSTRNAN